VFDAMCNNSISERIAGTSYRERGRGIAFSKLFHVESSIRPSKVP